MERSDGECEICRLSVDSLLLFACNHSMCSDCARKLEKQANGKCPNCRQPTIRSTLEFYRLFPARIPCSSCGLGIATSPNTLVNTDESSRRSLELSFNAESCGFVCDTCQNYEKDPMKAVAVKVYSVAFFRQIKRLLQFCRHHGLVSDDLYKDLIARFHLHQSVEDFIEDRESESIFNFILNQLSVFIDTILFLANIDQEIAAEPSRLDEANENGHHISTEICRLPNPSTNFRPIGIAYNGSFVALFDSKHFQIFRLSDGSRMLNSADLKSWSSCTAAAGNRIQSAALLQKKDMADCSLCDLLISTAHNKHPAHSRLYRIILPNGSKRGHPDPSPQLLSFSSSVSSLYELSWPCQNRAFFLGTSHSPETSTASTKPASSLGELSLLPSNDKNEQEECYGKSVTLRIISQLPKSAAQLSTYCPESTSTNNTDGDGKIGVLYTAIGSRNAAADGHPLIDVFYGFVQHDDRQFVLIRKFSAAPAGVHIIQSNPYSTTSVLNFFRFRNWVVPMMTASAAAAENGGGDLFLNEPNSKRWIQFNIKALSQKNVKALSQMGKGPETRKRCWFLPQLNGQITVLTMSEK